jgi:trigger factor
VEQETNATARGMVERIARQGATQEQILQQRDAIVNTAAQSSRDRVKLSYIMSRIADEESIEVEEAELDARIEALGKRYGLSAERFRSELEKRNGIEGLKSDIRSEKTMDFLMEHAKIKS